MLATKIQLGEMDQIVNFQEKEVETGSANSDRITDWTTIVGDYWAKVEENPGGEEFQANRLTGIQNVIFTIRYDSQITNKMRVVWQTRVYEISSPLVKIGRDSFLQITTRLLENEIVT